jgi:hypothetical protein
MACVIGIGCTGQTTDFHRVRLSWEPPHLGKVAHYKVYRLYGALNASSAAAVALVGTTDANTFSIVDSTELPDGSIANGKIVLYYVIAEFDDGVLSPVSNYVTIRPVNDAPTASNDGYTPTFTVTRNSSLNRTAAKDDDTKILNLKYVVNGQNVVKFSTAHGDVTFGADGTFTYTPAKNYTGPDTFTYLVNDGTFSYKAADGVVRNTGAAMSANSGSITVSITVTK